MIPAGFYSLQNGLEKGRHLDNNLHLLKSSSPIVGPQGIGRKINHGAASARGV